MLHITLRAVTDRMVTRCNWHADDVMCCWCASHIDGYYRSWLDLLNMLMMLYAFCVTSQTDGCYRPYSNKLYWPCWWFYMLLVLQIIFIVYMIMVTLLLVNMLIAMMGNTYELVTNTQKEWFRQVCTSRSSLLSSTLSLFYYYYYQCCCHFLVSFYPSSCMLVNHVPSQQSSKEEYKPWKWGATARYYASHTKTMLPMRKSVPRSSRQSDHTKTSWPL